MATTTVVTPQEVDSVIAYQERIEQEREQAEQEVFRMRKAIVHGGVQLDHVLIATEHERLLRFSLKTAGAVLHVPFVGGGLAVGGSGAGAKADLDHAHAAGLDSG